MAAPLIMLDGLQLTIASFVLLSIGAIVGSTINSLLSFGQSLVLVPLMILVVPAEATITSSLLLVLVSNVLIFISEHRPLAIDRHSVILITSASIPGGLLGIVLLTTIDRSILQVVVGAVVLWALAVAGIRRHRTLRLQTGLLVAAGAVSGCMNLATGLSGPPLAYIFARSGFKGDRLRDTLALSILAVNMSSFAIIAAVRGAGPLGQGGVIAFWLLPAVVVGQRMGRVAYLRVTAAHHVRIMFLLIGLVGIASAFRGIASLYGVF